jgi:hypothetical protein
MKRTAETGLHNEPFIHLDFHLLFPAIEFFFPVSQRKSQRVPRVSSLLTG